MGKDRLGELLSNGIERIQRSQRILEDCPDTPSAQATYPLGREIVDALAIEADFTRGDAAWWFQQADDCHAGERFPRARFAYNAEYLATSDGEGDVIHRDQCPSASRKLDSQVFYFE